MILLSSPDVCTPGVTSRDVAATLTQTAPSSEFGGWVMPVMAILIFVFAFSSVLGNHAYAEVNQDFLGGGHVGNLVMRLLVVVATFWGSVQSLGFVWSLADVAMSIMGVINLFALALLGKLAVATAPETPAGAGDR